MAKSGRKKESAQVLKMRGTDRVDRPREAPVEHLPGPARKPKWLKGLASDIWDDKLEIFYERGQSARGCESLLAQYCSLEAALIENYWSKGAEPPITMINSHRIYGNEFFDSPASQQVPNPSAVPSNVFNAHGKPPK